MAVVVMLYSVTRMLGTGARGVRESEEEGRILVGGGVTQASSSCGTQGCTSSGSPMVAPSSHSHAPRSAMEDATVRLSIARLTAWKVAVPVAASVVAADEPATSVPGVAVDSVQRRASATGVTASAPVTMSAGGGASSTGLATALGWMSAKGCDCHATCSTSVRTAMVTGPNTSPVMWVQVKEMRPVTPTAPCTSRLENTAMPVLASAETWVVPPTARAVLPEAAAAAQLSGTSSVSLVPGHRPRTTGAGCRGKERAAELGRAIGVALAPAVVLTARVTGSTRRPTKASVPG